MTTRTDLTLLQRKDGVALFGILVFLFAFYPDLFLAKIASLAGDHWEQHFPWAALLHQNLHHLTLPFWTPLIHCGFPIAAEGQIGVFYLPNLLLHFLLPLQWAYAYQNVFHFLVAGWSTYLYGRQMRLAPLAAFVASFVFLFGTAYGGAYYNITSLKTICWFPLSLFLFEKLFEAPRRFLVVLLGIILSFSLVAGYLQVGIYCLGMFLVYTLLRFVFALPETKSRLPFAQLSVALALSCLIASPQLYLTYQLAIGSNRTGLTEEYAYVGSMSPLAVVTLIWPLAQGLFRGNSLYIGLFPLFLLFFAWHDQETRRSVFFKTWATLGLLAALLALGKWSPLYILLIKLTHFYSFRTPAKFLVFVCFSMSLLSGLGLQVAWQLLQKSGSLPAVVINKVAKSFLWFLLAGAAGILCALSFLHWGRTWVFQHTAWYIRNFVYGKTGHPYSLEDYLSRIPPLLDSIGDFFYPGGFFQIWAVVLIAAHLILAGWLLKMKSLKRSWILTGLLLLGVDLYAFSWRDIRLDFGSYDRLRQKSPLVERLAADQKRGSIGRIYGFRGSSENLLLVPNANMLYDLSDVGVYSPFVSSRYFESIGQLGNINDSNFAFSPPPSFILERIPLLSALGVTHILSTTPLPHPVLTLIAEDTVSHHRLYRNAENPARTFCVSKVETFSQWGLLKTRLMEPGFDPRTVLLLEEAELQKLKTNQLPPESHLSCTMVQKDVRSNSATWEVTVRQTGFFVVTDTMVPGWTAKKDGKPVPLLKAYGLFQAVWIDAPGRYQIELKYSPWAGESS